MELFTDLRLDKNGDIPLYQQLYDKAKNMIEEGILFPGFRMPSIRQLSSFLSVNQVTVVSAYRLLEDEGYIYSKTGSGTFVADFIPAKDNRYAITDSSITDEIYSQDDLYTISNGQIKIDEHTINFASATPTPDLFPVDDFKVVMNEILDRDLGNAFGYQDSQGFFPIRECICGILGHTSIHCTPDHIQVISGAQQGIDIISKAFLKQGDYVITESPTYTGAIAVFKSRGAEIIDIELEPDGPNLAILEYNLKKYKPRLIYTIPSFQNPTGYSYSNAKRIEVLKLAEKYNAYIIEDDYVSDLDFEEKGFVPLKAMDKNSRVIFIKSFSKIFMPGLRLGFMVVPPSLQGVILEAKHSTDISTSGLIQRAFDLYIRKGFWDKHLKFMYQVYRKRYFKMVEALDACLPSSITYMRPGGGLNLWLSLPYGLMAGNLFKEAAARGIVFAPGKIFYSASSPQKVNNLRLSFAAVYDHQIENGIRQLCELFRQQRGREDSQRNLPIL